MSEGPVLVTGAAGFIGFHIAQRLLCNGCDVIGVDNMNDYYDPALKDARRAELAKSGSFEFVKLDLADRELTRGLFRDRRFPYVVHLAAQAGVRHSISHPEAYVDAYQLVIQNKDAISTIADHLVARKELYGDELIELLNSVGLKEPTVDLGKEETWPTL